jgi:hypothetical protein
VTWAQRKTGPETRFGMITPAKWLKSEVSRTSFRKVTVLDFATPNEVQNPSFLRSNSISI